MSEYKFIPTHKDTELATEMADRYFDRAGDVTQVDCFLSGFYRGMWAEQQRRTALEASLTAERKRADALAAALDGFVNYQAEGHFDEVLEHDEQLKSEARAALAAHHADRPGA